jgi:hypothetical protein
MHNINDDDLILKKELILWKLSSIWKKILIDIAWDLNSIEFNLDLI